MFANATDGIMSATANALSASISCSPISLSLRSGAAGWKELAFLFVAMQWGGSAVGWWMYVRRTVLT